MKWIKINKKRTNLPEKMQECLFTKIDIIHPLTGELCKPNGSFGWWDGNHFRSYIDIGDKWNPTHYCILTFPKQKKLAKNSKQLLTNEK